MKHLHQTFISESRHRICTSLLLRHCFRASSLRNKMKDLTVFVFLPLKLEQRLLKTAKEKMEQLSRALSEREFKARS